MRKWSFHSRRGRDCWLRRIPESRGLEKGRTGVAGARREARLLKYITRTELGGERQPRQIPSMFLTLPIAICPFPSRADHLFHEGPSISRQRLIRHPGHGYSPFEIQPRSSNLFQQIRNILPSISKGNPGPSNVKTTRVSK